MGSRLATMRGAFGLVGAILQGGRGGSGPGEDIRVERRGPIAEGFGITDIYRPAAGHSRRAAILMMHGLTEDGPDDHRVPTFASTCARGGMAVVVPEFPSMKARRMRVRDIDDVHNAALAVPELLGVDKVVLLAFSYAAGPTFLAAARMTHEQLAGTVTVGAYYDLDHVMEFTATGCVSAYGRSGSRFKLDPEKQFEGQWVFVSSAAAWLDDESDKRVIAAGEEAWKAGKAPSWESLCSGLGPEGRALVDSITLDDPELHKAARRRLPAGVVESMNELTLRGRIDSLTTPVVLIHGRHDVRIPYTESVLLRDEMRRSTDVKLAILNAFVHAQREVGWSRFWRVAGDAAKLGRCGFEIISWSV
jgi:pimeloyl-ACP methyl ester carboxylesterase